MKLHGKNLIATDVSGSGEQTYSVENANTGEGLTPEFVAATTEEIDEALKEAGAAYDANRSESADKRADLLERIADNIEETGDELVERVHRETALGTGRIRGERERTVGQLRMFADLVRDGSWLDVRIDTETEDLPDVRRTRIPIGPVAVFGANNFPLAFSVAGGDTASALAAGCPVVYKVHPGHPGTSEIVGRCVSDAVSSSDLHPGTFSLLHGPEPEVGLNLVKHPITEAVGFTGSLTAGRALFDAASSRERPIPVYAEMGSVNPVFVLPGALDKRGEEISEQLMQSVTLGQGQFCTNPGLVFGLEGERMSQFSKETAKTAGETTPGRMLNRGTRSGYENGLERVRSTEGVNVVAEVESDGGDAGTRSGAVVFQTDGETFLREESLMEEVFGPSTILVHSSSEEQLMSIAEHLDGNLSASIHGTKTDLREHRPLVRRLEQTVGRLIVNGFPTGVRVCHAMHHGGPYPATTDVRSTSVGTAAIERFVRPICYQDVPEELLPPELHDENKRNIWRLVDGTRTKEDL